MNKKKARMLFMLIVCGTLFFVLFVVVKQGKVRMGFGAKEQMELDIGNYDARKIDINGKYAVVAISGKGKVLIKGNEEQEVALDNALYLDVQNRAPQVSNQILYEEGDKIEIHKEDTVIVEGDDSFKIRLIKR